MFDFFSFTSEQKRFSNLFSHIGTNRYRATDFKYMIYLLKLGMVLGRKLAGEQEEGLSLLSMALQGSLLELEKKNQTEGFFSFQKRVS